MSIFRKELYDTINQSVLRGMFRLVGDHDAGFKYGDMPGDLDKSEFDVDNATPTEGWPRTSPDGYVIFLDPEVYGGSETNPPFYLNQPVNNGWLGLKDVIMPPADKCSSDDSNMLGLKNIVSRATDSYNRIDDDPRMFLDPDCDNETPFAKIHSREAASGVEAVIYTLSRVYIIENILAAMSAFSKVKPSFENNLDEIFFDYVAERMKDSLSELSTSFGKRLFEIDDEVVPIYWYLFLEQCVQLFVRESKAGNIQPTDDELEALSICQEAQNDYAFPTDGQISDEMNSLKSLLLSGGSLAALAPFGIVTGGAFIVLFRKLLKKKARYKLLLAGKLSTIADTEDACMVILKYFLKQESGFVADFIFKSLEENSEWENEGLIENLHEYFIKESDLLARNSDGNPLDVADKNLSNPLNDANASIPEYTAQSQTITENGMFVLERYIKIDPRADTVVASDDTSMRGVVNLSDFYDALKSGTFTVDVEDNSTGVTTAADTSKNISDYFGDLEIITDEDTGEESLSGTSNGISYGLRVSYIISKDFYEENLSSLQAFSAGLSSDEKTLISGLYLDDGYDSEEHTKFLLPLASTEVDLPDMTISELLSLADGVADPDELYFSQPSDAPENTTYYDCLLNQLLNSDDYELMFKQLVPIQRHFSLVALHVLKSFIYSVGSEEDGFKLVNFLGVFRNTLQDWDKEILQKTKKYLKILFMYQYNSSDPSYEDGNQQEDRSRVFDELLSGLNLDWNINLKWWLRRRRVKDVCPDDL
jgi:hypothetical protein